MAETPDGQERTERPTAKRVRDARQKGQVPRSRELSTLAALLASAAVFMAAGDLMLKGMGDVMRRNFTLGRTDLIETDRLPVYLIDAIIEVLWSMIPFVVALVIVAVLSNVALSGWNFSAAALNLKFDRLNPVTGLKRVFGWRGMVELLKALAKFLLVGAVALMLFAFQIDAFLGLGAEGLEEALAHTAEMLTWAFLVVSSPLLLVVLADIPFQLWDHQRQLKMSKQEVKEEHKQTEGSPEVKSRIRRMQFEAAQRRMMAEVPKADVVVTNPTHFAVALRYDQSRADAPVVTAKGTDLIAGKIRAVAVEHHVPILRAPALTRAIYYSTELEQPIPTGLYRAVAQVLAYVYHLRQGPVYDREGRTPELDVDELPIPDDLRRGP